MEVNEQKRISARKVVITSFAVDLLDVLLNLVVALLSGSIVMATQVLEALADLTASGFLFIGIQKGIRKEDRSHPFGYGREVYFWTLLASLLMFGITSTLSFYFGLQRFRHPEPIHDVNLALAVLLLTFFTNFYAFFLSLRRLLKKRSLKHVIPIFYRSSLVETKTTFTLDLMGTLASLLGMIALGLYAFYGDARWDGLGAMLIGIMLAFFSIFLILGIKDLLVGRSASPEIEKRISAATLRIPQVEKVVGIKTLHVGPERLLVDLDVNMNDHLSTSELEILIDKIKSNIRKEVPNVKYIQVELDTPQ